MTTGGRGLGGCGVGSGSAVDRGRQVEERSLNVQPAPYVPPPPPPATPEQSTINPSNGDRGALTPAAVRPDALRAGAKGVFFGVDVGVGVCIRVIARVGLAAFKTAPAAAAAAITSGSVSAEASRRLACPWWRRRAGERIGAGAAEAIGGDIGGGGGVDTAATAGWSSVLTSSPAAPAPAPATATTPAPAPAPAPAPVPASEARRSRPTKARAAV